MDFSHVRVASRFGLPTHRAVVFGLLLCCGYARGQINLVNLTSCGPGAFPGTACSIPATGGGHLIVVGLQAGSGANPLTTISSVTDNAGNVYAEATNALAVDAAAGTVIDLWYAKNSNSGATSITITPSAGIPNAAALVWELAGADPNSPLDQTAALSNQAASTSPVGAAVTTTAVNEFVVSMVAGPGTITGLASGNLFTTDSSLNGGGWAHVFTSSTGAYTPQWVQTPLSTFAASTASFKAASYGGGVDPCDLNGDGVVNVADAQLAVSMSLGQIPCTANIDGLDVCNVVIVQRVVNAASTGICVTGNSHSVSLTWTASISQNVAGYNVYRGVAPGGPYTQINSSLVTAETYSDATVQAGQTYYYVTSAADLYGNQSTYSNEASAVVPSP